jgi:predicted alpha/beta superfamily hydrolase
MDTAVRQITAAGKHVELFGVLQGAAPLVIYHAVHGEGNALWNACKDLSCPSFSLAVINDVRWNDEMSPWAIPPLSGREEPCTGGADAYLLQFTENLLPAVCGALPQPPTRLLLAGYSLGGLFALYAAYRADCFAGIASASGSLWYPGMAEFVKTHSLSAQTKSVYFSLGNRESHTKNPLLATVEQRTREIQVYLQGQGIRTVYEVNPGNHYKDAVPRMAKGIGWLLCR